MKATIQALFESDYNENGLTAYFKVEDLAEDQQQAEAIRKKYANPYNEKYDTIGVTGFRGKPTLILRVQIT